MRTRKTRPPVPRKADGHTAATPTPPSRLTLNDAQARARIMKALGHSARMQILDLLDQQDLCLCELHPLFKMRQPTLSRHLSVLKQAGLITERRAGPRLILHLATPCILRALDCAMETVQTIQRRQAQLHSRPA